MIWAQRYSERSGYKICTGPDAFGSKKQIQTKYWHPFDPEIRQLNEPNDNSNKIDMDKLSQSFPRVVTSYEVCKQNPYACQRDYVYFGMTSNSSKGILRKNVRDVLYRFKLGDDTLGFVADDDNDPKRTFRETSYVDHFEVSKSPRQELSDSEILATLWSDGALEIVVAFLDNTTAIQTYPLDVKLKDCYSVNATVKYWHHTMFKWYRDWEVSVTSMMSIKACPVSFLRLTSGRLLS